MLQTGWYLTQEGRDAHIHRAIAVRDGLGWVHRVGVVAYLPNGQFAYKDEHPDKGDSLDLLLETRCETRDALRAIVAQRKEVDGVENEKE